MHLWLLSFREGIAAALNELELLLCDLLGEQLVRDQLMDYRVEQLAQQDDLGDVTPHFWFGQGRGGAAVEASMKQRLVEDAIFHTLSAQGTPALDSSKLVDFILKADKASDLLCFLLQVTAGQPARMTRLAFLLYKNLPTAKRGVFVRQGRVFVAGHWDKNRGQGHDSPSGVRFPCRKTSGLLLLFICYLRPLYNQAMRSYREAAAKEGQAESEPPMTHSFLLLQWRGRQANEDHLRGQFKALFTRYFRTTAIGVRDWRHLNKALVRLYLPSDIAAMLCPASEVEEEDDSGGDAEAIWADMAGHTTSTAVQVYGRLITADEVGKTQAAAAAYQRLLGLEPSVKPEVAGSRESPGSESGRRQLSEAVLDALQSPQHQQLLTSVVTEAIKAELMPRHVLGPGPQGHMGSGHDIGTDALVPTAEEALLYLQRLRLEVGSTVNFRAPQQVALLHALVRAQDDCLGVVRVGGGKSTLLNVAAQVS
jgi:hypothetical protein